MNMKKGERAREDKGEEKRGITDRGRPVFSIDRISPRNEIKELIDKSIWMTFLIVLNLISELEGSFY